MKKIVRIVKISCLISGTDAFDLKERMCQTTQKKINEHLDILPVV